MMLMITAVVRKNISEYLELYEIIEDALQIAEWGEEIEGHPSVT